MSLKDQKEIISEIFERLFGKEDKISFYFMKKGKSPSNTEAIISYKTRKKIDSEKMEKTEVLLQKETGQAELKLMKWSEVIGKIVPTSKVFKIPFFDSSDVSIKFHPWRLCPIGEHWVRRHPKRLHSGSVTDHDGHCRKNKKTKTEFYHADELKLIA